jgi:hypothetical protein
MNIFISLSNKKHYVVFIFLLHRVQDNVFIHLILGNTL